jgi:methionyl-tRNA formyltransferase
MRVVFAGTPAFAAVILGELLQAFEIVAVLTPPDRPANRGLRTEPGAVKALALRHGFPVFQFASLKSPDAAVAIERADPDVMVVAAYGMLFPRRILDIPRLGCLNVHASLLPRWRGAAPIARAILAGDSETGISIMKMDEGLDTGPVLMQRSVAIGEDDTAASLQAKLARVGATMIVEALPLYAQGELVASPQFETGVTYANKIEKTEARVNWRRSAGEVARHIRALNPAPGAHAVLGDETVKLWMANAHEEISGAAAEVVAITAAAIVVACQFGAVALTELQKAGGRRLSAADFARGFRINPGMKFD